MTIKCVCDLVPLPHQKVNNTESNKAVERLIKSHVTKYIGSNMSTEQNSTYLRQGLTPREEQNWNDKQ